MYDHSSSESARRYPAPHIVTAGDFTVKAGWTLGPRKLHDYELVYFPIGSATQYKVADTLYVLDEPCFILTRPSEEHTYLFDPSHPTRHLFIHFMTDSLTGCHDLTPLLSPGGLSWLRAGHTSLVPSLFKQLLHLAAYKPFHWEQRGNLLLYTILAEIEGLAATEPDPLSGRNLPMQVTKALQYIDKHLPLPLSIAQIADHVGWTHEHFTRVFVQHMGITPQKAISHRRIERACQLLLQTASSIKQIAYEVGFRDEHYFSRCFIQVKGVTASEYRDRYEDPRVRHLAPVEDYQGAYPLNRIIK
ncbi:helix-turn-helix domain-containing protein [Paenibacillus sp. NPDC056579]|uniref:AraC family transcriptional regulator n=1 Tax=unclassified Paenibacillus TaxID=185978 RepID=UPI001EF7BC1F|nr:AraC family transcriptional regulator [Paenibacillus sp. H1-7]ULL17745.1 AraC family transcriptional regulator [Paenibacillus sp. H1-7]